MYYQILSDLEEIVHRFFFPDNEKYMRCYIENILSEADLQSDIKTWIPDAMQRRRMSRILKIAISTAAECMEGLEGIEGLDAIITSTGWGCLQDSEKFLRNLIQEEERLLNPTPFIQSTFNTIGGQIAMLRSNHCYNVTYVNRNHSFEDALLDAQMRILDGESHFVLVGAYDEQTPSQHQILSRMGIYRQHPDGEGCVFVRMGSSSVGAQAELYGLYFPDRALSENECKQAYADSEQAVVLYNEFSDTGIYPTLSAKILEKAVHLILKGTPEVIVYNQFWQATPAVMKLKCIS